VGPTRPHLVSASLLHVFFKKFLCKKILQKNIFELYYATTCYPLNHFTMATDRLSELEQELMDLEYQQEQEHFERIKDEPGLQEFSLAAPAAKVGILSQALKTGASKLLAPLQNLFSRINPTAAAAPISTGSETLAGLPSIMARGSGKGFERFGKRRGATTSRVNQNLDELISDFFAQSKGGTDLSNVSPYTIELIQANMPAIRAAAARQKQNPKAGLNRVIQLMEELE
jgi:hypothetical protein